MHVSVSFDVNHVEIESLKVTLICCFQTAASVLTHHLLHSAKLPSQILPQRGMIMTDTPDVPERVLQK